MASSSSAHTPHHHLHFPHGATAAPPPTPSSQPNPLLTDSTSDALATLLHRLPTTLSLPSSRFSRPRSPKSTAPPSISLSQPRADVLSAISAASSDHGFFQLTHHRVTSQLAESAESDSASFLALPSDHKRRLFPMNWPLGFDDDQSDDENASFCLNSVMLAELSVSSLTELTRELERLGIEIVELLTCALGLENPFMNRGEPEKMSSLMWVSESEVNGKTGSRCYPYAVGLMYQIRSQEYRLETDTGPVLVKPEPGSVLVTLGDIAQVWSNGITKKVRGRPIPTTFEGEKDSVSMSLLLTLPLDSIISPLLQIPRINDDEDVGIDRKKREEVDLDDGEVSEGEKRVCKFNSIPFEDYAWRVYHERLFLKDSLDRYRILSD